MHILLGKVRDPVVWFNFKALLASSHILRSEEYLTPRLREVSGARKKLCMELTKKSIKLYNML